MRNIISHYYYYYYYYCYYHYYYGFKLLSLVQDLG